VIESTETDQEEVPKIVEVEEEIRHVEVEIPNYVKKFAISTSTCLISSSTSTIFGTSS
jgi:hypothetical protein